MLIIAGPVVVLFAVMVPVFFLIYRHEERKARERRRARLLP